jgi:putative transposase
VGPSQRKDAVRALQARGLSQRQACVLAGCPRKTAQYRSRKPPPDPQLVERIKAVAERWPRFGYRRLFIMLRREAVELSWWRLRRIYRQLGLHVRPKRKRHVRYIRGAAITPVAAPNQRWSIDFVHDRLALGRPIRVLVVVDDFTRECLALEVAFSFSSADVIRTLEQLRFLRGLAAAIRFDRGSEFTSRVMLHWSAERNVMLQFSDPGKPTQNANVESLNGRIRDELLNLHSFANIAQARDAAENWRQHYNGTRPHSALGYRTPREFAEQFETTRPSQESVA